MPDIYNNVYYAILGRNADGHYSYAPTGTYVGIAHLTPGRG